MFGLKKGLVALALIVALFGGSQNVLAQGADGTTLSWKVRGEISAMPGQPATVPFSCTVTAASPSCSLPTGSIALDFVGVDSDSFKAQFKSAKPCGGADNCTALWTDDETVNDQVDSVTCNGSTITAAPAAPARAYFPCAFCFGGLKPSFEVTWRAVADCTTSTTSTSSTSTSTSSTTTST